MQVFVYLSCATSTTVSSNGEARNLSEMERRYVIYNFFNIFEQKNVRLLGYLLNDSIEMHSVSTKSKKIILYLQMPVVLGIVNIFWGILP